MFSTISLFPKFRFLISKNPIVIHCETFQTPVNKILTTLILLWYLMSKLKIIQSIKKVTKNIIIKLYSNGIINEKAYSVK